LPRVSFAVFKILVKPLPLWKTQQLSAAQKFARAKLAACFSAPSCYNRNRELNREAAHAQPFAFAFAFASASASVVAFLSVIPVGDLLLLLLLLLPLLFFLSSPQGICFLQHVS
jgi:hypothetical protein